MIDENKIVVIGITGSIGSGKSTVANIIAEKGYKVISSDENAKVIMNSNIEVIAKIKSTFGCDFYNNDGSINKPFIMAKIFGYNEATNSNREKLNQIVHPVVIEKMISEIELLMKAGEKIVFVESALMFETGLFEGFDYIVTVNTNKAILIKRVMDRNNLSADDVERRLKAQISQEEKKKYADFVIENSGSLESLEQSVNFLLPILTNLPPKEIDEEE